MVQPRRHQRRCKQRQDMAAAMKPFEWRVGAHHDPGKRQPDHDGDQGAAAAGNQRVEQRLGDVRIGQHGEEVRDRQWLG